MSETVKSIRAQSKRLSFKIAAIYAVVGILWILFSDKLAAMLFPSHEALTQISIIKGWFYVALTAVLLYILCTVT